MTIHYIRRTSTEHDYTDIFVYDSTINKEKMIYTTDKRIHINTLEFHRPVSSKYLIDVYITKEVAETEIFLESV